MTNAPANLAQNLLGSNGHYRAIATSSTARSLQEQYLRQLGAEEFRDRLLNGGSYCQLDQWAIALADTLRANRPELKRLHIELINGDRATPCQVLGSLLEFYGLKTASRRERRSELGGGQVRVYRIKTAIAPTAKQNIQKRASKTESHLGRDVTHPNKSCNEEIDNRSLTVGDRETESHLSLDVTHLDTNEKDSQNMPIAVGDRVRYTGQKVPAYLPLSLAVYEIWPDDRIRCIADRVEHPFVTVALPGEDFVKEEAIAL